MAGDIRRVPDDEVDGDPSGEALVRAPAAVVGRLASRARSHKDAPDG